MATAAGASHAVATASGTAGLHVALVALGVGRDEFCAAALLAGDNAFEKSFTFKDAPGTDGLDWVEATPKAKDSTFARVRLGFKGEVLSDMEMQDNFGQTTLIKFGAVEKNPSIAPTQFKFAPPAGVDVVGE